jgi:hypothetical protein
MGDLSGLRWLARAVTPGAVTAGLPQLPPPVLVSANLTTACREYVCRWIANPDPSGRFARKTRWLRRLPAPLLLRVLFALGYDGVIYVTEAGIIGHVFFQRRGAAVHGFSTAVGEGFDGHGYSVVMMLDYVAYAASIPGVVKARVGTGQNNVTRRLLARLKKQERRLGWHVTPDGWVGFHADSWDQDRPPADTQASSTTDKCAS